MKRAMTMAAALMGAAMAASASADVVYDDARVSREFIYTTKLTCGTENAAGSSLDWILHTCCNNDTNRYVRVAKETALTNDVFKSVAVQIVRKHGGVEDVPFLYQCTNDLESAEDALEGILKFEGLTESSLAAASAFLALTNTCRSLERNWIAIKLFGCAAHSSASAELRALASSNALAFARSSDDVRYNDRLLKGADPTYEYSKRRLSVLRAVLPLCRGYEILENYTTNAINELVAYPESALPD